MEEPKCGVSRVTEAYCLGRLQCIWQDCASTTDRRRRWTWDTLHIHCHFIEVQSLNMFWALLAHHQETLHERSFSDFCVIVDVGWSQDLGRNLNKLIVWSVYQVGCVIMLLWAYATVGKWYPLSVLSWESWWSTVFNSTNTLTPSFGYKPQGMVLTLLTRYRHLMTVETAVLYAVEAAHYDHFWSRDFW
jgi:hypothetical protein